MATANDGEVSFSVVQRRVLTPDDFQSIAELEGRLVGFQEFDENGREG